MISKSSSCCCRFLCLLLAVVALSFEALVLQARFLLTVLKDLLVRDLFCESCEELSKPESLMSSALLPFRL